MNNQNDLPSGTYKKDVDFRTGHLTHWKHASGYFVRRATRFQISEDLGSLSIHRNKSMGPLIRKKIGL